MKKIATCFGSQRGGTKPVSIVNNKLISAADAKCHFFPPWPPNSHPRAVRAGGAAVIEEGVLRSDTPQSDEVRPRGDQLSLSSPPGWGFWSVFTFIFFLILPGPPGVRQRTEFPIWEFVISCSLSLDPNCFLLLPRLFCFTFVWFLVFSIFAFLRLSPAWVPESCLLCAIFWHHVWFAFFLFVSFAPLIPLPSFVPPVFVFSLVSSLFPHHSYIPLHPHVYFKGFFPFNMFQPYWSVIGSSVKLSTGQFYKWTLSDLWPKEIFPE